MFHTFLLVLPFLALVLYFRFLLLIFLLLVFLPLQFRIQRALLLLLFHRIYGILLFLHNVHPHAGPLRFPTHIGGYFTGVIFRTIILAINGFPLKMTKLQKAGLTDMTILTSFPFTMIQSLHCFLVNHSRDFSLPVNSFIRMVSGTHLTLQILIPTLKVRICMESN